MLLEFSARLMDWFWAQGLKREKEFAISTSDWTRGLYEVRKDLLLAREATQRERPSFAIWGPSQTGKSTLVSAYIDETAIATLRAAAPESSAAPDLRTALHWAGAEPVFFSHPKDVYGIPATALPAQLTVLNPFRMGADASACLSRFVHGSLKGEPGSYQVRAAEYPIELHLVTEKDLLHALARGYDTECDGPLPGGRQPNWTVARFQNALDDFKNRHYGGSIEPNRQAYELLHDVCEVLDDLVFAELPRYVELLEEGEVNWKTILNSLLGEKTLIADEALVEQFAAELLWDGCEKMTLWFQKMRAARQKYAEQWAGKSLHCTHQVAALFLDMSAIVDYFSEAPTQEQLRESVVRQAIPRLAYRIEGNDVHLGFEPQVSTRLNLSPEEFGLLQGLVWEMVIPLNPAHLSDSPFSQFLKKADLLDFPGVGNEKSGKSTRVRIWNKPEEGSPGAAPDGGGEAKEEGRPFTPVNFFRYILKRGKTASIVSSYAKRMTIDGFSVFQNIDQQPPVNAAQLRTGIDTWLKSLVPEYYTRQVGPSPLPMNLALCWWAPLLNQVGTMTGTILGEAERIYQHLGKIGHPDFVTATFAMNYYQFWRGRIDKPEADVQSIKERIRSETAFQTQFKGQVSQTSFETMFADKRTGGTNYFFSQLTVQVEQSRANPQFNRLALLAEKEKNCAARLLKLLTEYNLFPPPPVEDVRLLYLDNLRDSILALVEGKSEKDLRPLNHALREFLNINYVELQPVPRDLAEINEEFIRAQYGKWINSQADKYRTWRTRLPANGGGEAAPPAPRTNGHAPAGRTDFAGFKELLGINSESQFRRYLEALVASIDPATEMKEVAAWLRRLAQYRSASARPIRSDLRPHLAVRMANLLVYGQRGIESFDPADLAMGEEDDDGQGPEVKGKRCPSYQVFLKAFLESQLPWLKRKKLEGHMLAPVELPGENELREAVAAFRTELLRFCPQAGDDLQKLLTAKTPAASQEN